MNKIKNKNLLKGFDEAKLLDEVKKYVEQVEGKRMDLSENEIDYNIFLCGRHEDEVMILSAIYIDEDGKLKASVDSAYDNYEVELDFRNNGNVYLESIIPIVRAVEDYIDYVVNDED